MHLYQSGEPFIYPSDKKCNIVFYGFERREYNYNGRGKFRYRRFVLYRSGKYFLYDEIYSCRDREIKRKTQASLFECCFNTKELYIEEFKYWAFQKCRIPNCGLCRYYVPRYYGTDKICRHYKVLGISSFNHDTEKAKTCPLFCVDEVEMKKALEKISSHWNSVLRVFE